MAPNRDSRHKNGALGNPQKSAIVRIGPEKFVARLWRGEDSHLVVAKGAADTTYRCSKAVVLAKFTLPQCILNFIARARQAA
jgi:hypothetical protein